MKKKNSIKKFIAVIICILTVISTFTLISFAETVTCDQSDTPDIYVFDDYGYSVVGHCSIGLSNDLKFLAMSVSGLKVGTTNTKVSYVGCSGSTLYYKTISMSTYINGSYNSSLSSSYSKTSGAPTDVDLVKQKAINGSIRVNGAIVAKSSSKTYTAQANTKTYT